MNSEMVQAAPRAVLGAIVTVLALAGCGDDDESKERAQPETERRFVELASAELADGRRVVLRSFGAGTEVGPCLTLVGLDQYKRQCGRAPSERVPSHAGDSILAGPIAQLRPDAPFEVYGETSADVVRVLLRFNVNASTRQQRAVLMRVLDAETLVSAGIRQPFGYFLAELPPDAWKIRATAFDSEGDEIGSDDYDEFRDLHPRSFIANAP
jgi:hypothetical protein